MNAAAQSIGGGIPYYCPPPQKVFLNPGNKTHATVISYSGYPVGFGGARVESVHQPAAQDTKIIKYLAAYFFKVPNHEGNLACEYLGNHGGIYIMANDGYVNRSKLPKAKAKSLWQSASINFQSAKVCHAGRQACGALLN